LISLDNNNDYFDFAKAVSGKPQVFIKILSTKMVVIGSNYISRSKPVNATTFTSKKNKQKQ